MGTGNFLTSFAAYKVCIHTHFFKYENEFENIFFSSFYMYISFLFIFLLLARK